jgi:ElaB/YqjD/DUF883 family membrane-anchored ribosome-binding protein
MDMAALLKGAANCLAAASVMKWIAVDLEAEIRRDGSRLRQKADRMVKDSPYRAVGLAAAAGALTGIVLTRRRR